MINLEMTRLYENMENILHSYISLTPGEHTICIKYWLSLKSIDESKILAIIYKAN